MTTQGWENGREESSSGVGVLDRPTPEAVLPQLGRLRRVGIRIWLARADIAIATGYLSLAVLVLSRQWWHPESGYLIKSRQDQFMWEWFFAVTAYKVAHLEIPLGTSLQNVPDGVNMMANTASFGVGVPLTPITLLFGPTVTFTLALTLGLCGTAFAWYWLFSRELVDSKAAAAVGGLFCGFAPAMISHANAHPNFVVLAVLPLLALQIIRMAKRAGASKEARKARWLRDAFILGPLVALQIALGEEPLLIFALAFGLFALVYYLHSPRAGLRALRVVTPTVLLAALITLALTGIPLWWQFLGPQSYRYINHGPVGNDLKALFQFPSGSLGGMVIHGQDVALNSTEENSYFGWPLLLLVTATAMLMWRERVVRAAAAVIVAFTVLSLGSTLIIGKGDTGILLPWLLAEQLPLLSTVLESRLTMAAIPAIALILAMATQRAMNLWRESATSWRPVVWCTALVVALLPLTPTILPVAQRAPTPSFFTDGTVQQYVSGGSVVIAPPLTPEDARALFWQAESSFQFPPAGGYFLGPTGPDKKGQYGPDPRRTATLLVKVQQADKFPTITDADREQALADLRYWHADLVVLPPTDHADVLRATLNELLGIPAQRVDDVWLWDVRGLV